MGLKQRIGKKLNTLKGRLLYNKINLKLKCFIFVKFKVKV